MTIEVSGSISEPAIEKDDIRSEGDYSGFDHKLAYDSGGRGVGKATRNE